MSSKMYSTPTAECDRVVANICTISLAHVAQRASERENGIKAKWYFTISGILLCFFVLHFKKGESTYK